MTGNTSYFRGDWELTRKRSFTTALEQLAEAADGLGFVTVDYGFMPQVRTSDGRYHAPTIVGHNLPQRWRSGWGAFVRDDPLLYGAYPRTLPLDWREIKDAPWLSPIQREAFNFIQSLGIRDGVTIPIHLPGDAFAFVTVGCRDRDEAWRARTTEVLERLFVLAHAFHAQHGEGAGGAVKRSCSSALSIRERIVLEHAALGHSAPETAQLIHRSVETVRVQRKSAMHKLGARTIAQAVACAVRKGIIEFNPAG